jgi:hypothetical protein
MIFKKYEKELNKAGYFISTDQVVNSRGDVMGQMDPYGSFLSSDDDLMVLICKAAQAEAQADAKAKEDTAELVKEVKKAKAVFRKTSEE